MRIYTLSSPTNQTHICDLLEYLKFKFSTPARFS